MNRIVSFLLLFLSLTYLDLSAQTEVLTTEMSSLYKTTSFNQISVHDPSVIYNETDGYFYIFGSHYYGAKSKDLRNWSAVTNYYKLSYDKAFKSSPARKVKRALNGVTEEVDFPSFDAAAWCATYAANNSVTESQWLNGVQWAPDVVWNPTMNKWCYYVSLDGDFWSSVIVLMTSDNITGPYVYQGPVVMGGFIGSNTSSDNTNKITPPSYKDSDLEIVLGELSSLPSRYNRGNSNGTYWPNCIDPCVFFDEEGELWLAYGSWSGGIFMLKLDKETGLRDYTYTYANVNADNANCTSDPYFGKKIAGGYYVSGEGPYIQHFGDYYYLFMSYGGFAPDGGYEMRVFRSSSPDGPYVDASGTSALYTDVKKWVLNFGANASTNRGMKLIGAMNGWGTMTVGECAQGHNSACTDADGRNFLVCHTKYNNGTAGHNVRSYQLYINSNGWLVCAPFQFAGETVNDDSIATGCKYTASEIAGDYHVLIHPYKLNHNNYEEAVPGTIHLAENGKITGDYTGTWTMTSGTSYIKVKLGSNTYNGVLVEQTLENNTAKTLCFTAVNDTKTSSACGVPVWGYKLQPKNAIAYNYNKYKSTCLSVSRVLSVNKNVEILFDPEENTTISWTSSEPDVVTSEGKYNPKETAVTLTMTARLESGDYFWQKDYTCRAAAAAEVKGDQTTGLVAYYDFNSSPVSNLYDDTQRALMLRANSSTTLPALHNDYARFGKVVHQYYGSKGYNSYVRMVNPLKGAADLDGFTVSAWIKRTDDDKTNGLWSFFNSVTSTATGARLFLTGNSYVGFDDNNGNWFDINNPESKTVTKMGVGEWHLMTMTFSKDDGCALYIDGSAYLSIQMNWEGSTDKTSFDNSLVLDFVKNASYFYLGLGSNAGSADACFDDLMIYNRALSSDDVQGLSVLLNRVNDFSPQADAISEVQTVEDDDVIYDLTGRRVTSTRKGVYIINGKKVMR